jgi:hypothetical protein
MSSIEGVFAMNRSAEPLVQANDDYETLECRLSGDHTPLAVRRIQCCPLQETFAIPAATV